MDVVVGFSVEMSEHSGSEREIIHRLRILKLASNMEGAQENWCDSLCSETERCVVSYVKKTAVWNDLRNHKTERNSPQSWTVGACEGHQLYETRRTEEEL